MRLILTVFISYSCFILHPTNLFASTPAPQKTNPPSTTCSQSPPPLSKFITTIQKTLTQAQGPVLPTPCQPTLSAPPRTPPLKPGDSLKYNEPCGHEPKKQTLILIHGLNSSSETWTNTQNELCKNPDLRVITYDLRGHGESKAEGDDYSLDTMAGDLEALRNHLHLDSFHLIAHSYGARIALKYTKKFPSHVQSLILEDQDVFTRAETPG